MDSKYKIDVACRCCGTPHSVRKYDVKDVSDWSCKPCATSARNKRSAKPDGTVRLHRQSGYLEEKSGGAWRRQHVLLIERLIGRRLGSDEVVHHKNEIKTDNRLDNLELMTVGEHSIIHNTGKKFTQERIKNIALAHQRNGVAKLNPESVAWIKDRAKEGLLTRAAMALELGVSSVTVGRVINNQSWRI